VCSNVADVMSERPGRSPDRSQSLAFGSAVVRLRYAVLSAGCYGGRLGGPLYSQADIVRPPSDVCFVPIVLKNSKMKQRGIFAKRRSKSFCENWLPCNDPRKAAR
jgi:hypothetical protein